MLLWSLRLSFSWQFLWCISALLSRFIFSRRLSKSMNEQWFSDWVVWLQEEPEDLESSSSFLVSIHILRLTWGPFPLMSLRKKWVEYFSLILFVVVALSYFVYRMSSLMSSERHGHLFPVSLSCLDVVRMSLLQETSHSFFHVSVFIEFLSVYCINYIWHLLFFSVVSFHFLDAFVISSLHVTRRRCLDILSVYT